MSKKSEKSENSENSETQKARNTLSKFCNGIGIDQDNGKRYLNKKK